MTRPYSEDLRERALARFEAGETHPLDRGGVEDQPVLRFEVAQAEGADGLARPRQDRRAQEAAPVGRGGRLVARALPVGPLHDARADGRAHGARARRVAPCSVRQRGRCRRRRSGWSGSGADARRRRGGDPEFRFEADVNAAVVTRARSSSSFSLRMLPSARKRSKIRRTIAAGSSTTLDHAAPATSSSSQPPPRTSGKWRS